MDKQIIRIADALERIADAIEEQGVDPLVRFLRRRGATKKNDSSQSNKYPTSNGKWIEVARRSTGSDDPADLIEALDLHCEMISARNKVLEAENKRLRQC